MSLMFPNLLQSMETQGWCVVTNSLSERLCFMLRKRPPKNDLLNLIRQTYEGIPRRIASSFTGELILSQYQYGIDSTWTCGRIDLVNAQLPDVFVPGYAFAVNLSTQAVDVKVLGGFRQLVEGEQKYFDLAQTVHLNQEDLLMMDCRLWHHWPESVADDIFWFVLVRSWIEVHEDFSEYVRENTPPRALRFYGSADKPFTNVGEWIFSAHTNQHETK